MTRPSGLATPMKEPEHSSIQRIEKYVPGIGLIRTYKRDLLKTDVIAAATVFAILVPSALAYGELAGFEPAYEELPGWEKDLRSVSVWEDLPKQARAYILRIEELSGVPVRMVSVGPEREQVVEIG